MKITTESTSDSLAGNDSRLAELERDRQELTSLMGHDMLNLIHGIVGFFDLVDQGTLTPQSPEFAEFISVASQYSRELMLMVNAILDIYRLEDGRLALNRRPTDFSELLTYSSEQVRSIAAQNDVRLFFDLPADLPLLDVDGDLIVRVLSNLLLSAIKASPAGEQVRTGVVICPESPSMVQVSISDAGKSVAGEELAALFERFPGADRRNLKRRVGLGLSFCKQAVELHGGRIWAESRDEGGVVYHFTLPVAAESG